MKKSKCQLNGKIQMSKFGIYPVQIVNPVGNACFIYSSTSHTLKDNIFQRGKHLTGFRYFGIYPSPLQMSWV